MLLGPRIPCDTKRMRVYCPATSSDLSATRISAVPAWTVVARPGAREEDVEILESDAQTEAALASLNILRERPTDALRRIVLAVDIDEEVALVDGSNGPAFPPTREENEADPLRNAGVVVALRPMAINWNSVVAILVDEEDAEDQVRQVIDAQEQEEADAAVAELWEEYLLWYDIDERDDVMQDLSAHVR